MCTFMSKGMLPEKETIFFYIVTNPLQSPALLYQLDMASATLGIPTESVVGFKGTHDRNPHKS